jgi:TatA/E family protein of Tat protein translocase
MEISLFKLLLIAFVILVFFGTGKLPSAMKDLGISIRKFKEGLNEDELNKDSSNKKIS